ncbi:unnamed protein product [Cylicostephanus goldi]|uniref:Uncharacterized protein n=1 Tax=Cylicostephanus goldi TaxID=71465 RepID=A0A3P7MXX0_CYLGO|nr:unnamed protein product [Cylicostephanus goldi]
MKGLLRHGATTGSILKYNSLTSGQHKLYFGEIYNVTGYEFLDAYAFTTYCACEGTCCGQVRLTTSNTIAYQEVNLGPLNHVMSDAEQTLYIANVLNYDNMLWAKADSTECVDLI